MQRKKRKISWATLITALLLFALAGVLLWAGGYKALGLLRGPVDLASLSPNALNGRYVEASVSSLVDEYALLEVPGGEAQKETSIYGREYVMYLPSGENVMGLLVSGKELEELESALNALLKEGAAALPVVVRGVVAPMEESDRELFLKALEFYSLSDGMAVYSVLEVGASGGVSLERVYGLFGFAVAAGLGGLSCALLSLRRRRGA